MDILKLLQSNPKVLVLGGGITGQSVIQFLKKFTSNILLIDMNSPRETNGFTYFSDSVRLSFLGKIDLAIKSPGFKPSHPILSELRQRNIPILSEIELARNLFKGKIIGITGTDGKSTTTALTYHILQKSFPESKMGGNIGIPFIEFCQENLDFAVLELSSYQLEDSNPLNLDISAILNIAPDHLERHGNMENYMEAKKKIINRDSSSATFISNEKTIEKIKIEATDLKVEIKTFGELNDCSAIINLEESKIKTNLFPYSTIEFTLHGKHNLENLAASILICEAAGCIPKNIQSSFKDFTGLHYRFQKIKEWNGTTFINDSKSTNIHSLLSGLAGIKNRTPIILIIGGKQKNEDLFPLINRLQELTVLVYLIGEARFHWEKKLRMHLKENLSALENLEQAVKSIHEKISKTKIETVLFSPACASFDQYKNFEERGKHFTDLVNENFL